MKILVVEDESALRDTMVESLQRENYLVETASNYREALDKTQFFVYDCILLDIGLPDGNGLAILESLKKEGLAEGVIIVSARNSIDDRVAGLNLGADDYLPKPFHLAEMNARVKSVIRRRKYHGNSRIECNEVSIDTENRQVFVRNTELLLNRKEFDILLYLIINRNRLVNKTALAEHVWGDYIDETNSFDFIYSQIKNLRKKLKDGMASLQIQAVYGVGYKLTTNETA